MKRALQFSLSGTDFGILAGVLAVFLASTSAPAAARTVRDPYGGRGDAHASDECGPGKYFVGVVGATGAWLDQMAVLCAELKPDGTFKGAKSMAARGGTGGAFHPAVMCPKDQAITDVTVSVSANLEVLQLELFCTGVKNPALRTPLLFAGNGGDYRSENTQSCAPGEVGKGLNLNYGKSVNGVGIICDALKIPAAAPPPPPPPTSSPPPPPPPPDTPAPPPAEQFVAVLKDVDVYTKPGGNDQDRKTDANGNDVSLLAGTQGVTLIEKKTPWFHLKWPGQDGWVYSGSGWVSLKLP